MREGVGSRFGAWKREERWEGLSGESVGYALEEIEVLVWECMDVCLELELELCCWR